MAKRRDSVDGDWELIEEVFCPTGDNDRAIRDFQQRRPDLTAQPKRLQMQILCYRHDGTSSVRFLWNRTAPEPTTRRKPRHAIGQP